MTPEHSHCNNFHREDASTPVPLKILCERLESEQVQLALATRSDADILRDNPIEFIYTLATVHTNELDSSQRVKITQIYHCLLDYYRKTKSSARLAKTIYIEDIGYYSLIEAVLINSAQANNKNFFYQLLKNNHPLNQDFLRRLCESTIKTREHKNKLIAAIKSLPALCRDINYLDNNLIAQIFLANKNMMKKNPNFDESRTLEVLELLINFNEEKIKIKEKKVNNSQHLGLGLLALCAMCTQNMALMYALMPHIEVNIDATKNQLQYNFGSNEKMTQPAKYLCSLGPQEIKSIEQHYNLNKYLDMNERHCITSKKNKI